MPHHQLESEMTPAISVTLVAADVSPRAWSPMKVCADSRRRLHRAQPEAWGQDTAANAPGCVRKERRIHPAGEQPAPVTAG